MRLAGRAGSGSAAMVLLSGVLALLLVGDAWAQVTSPIAYDTQVKAEQAATGNKYRERKADMDKEGDIQHEGPVPGASRCGRHRLDLSWMSEATSSVYASPLITDLHADGRRDIIVPAFVHYLEVLEGPNGGQAPGGWPAFHASSVHASPLLYDIDFDGVRDVLLATYDGQVLFYKDTGDKMHEGLQISRLRVRKDWYVGLDPNDPFDHSHPDVGDSDGGRGARGTGAKRMGGGGGGGKSEPGSGGSGGANYSSGSKSRDGTPFAGGVAVTGMSERVKKFVKQISEYRSKYGDAAADKLMAEARVTNAVFYEAVLQALKQTDVPGSGTSSGTGASSGGASSGGGGGGRRRLMAADGAGDAAGAGAGAGAGGDSTAAATGSGGAATVEYAGAGDAVSSEAAESFDIFSNAQDQGDLYDAALGDSGAIDAADLEAEEAMRAAAGDGDGAEAALAGGDSAGEGGLDGFLDRLQYDEFGDLETTVEYNIARAVAEAHDHGFDSHGAGDGGDLSSDRYNHLYLGDYVGGAAGGAAGLGGKGWGDEDFIQPAHPDSAGGSHVWVDPHVMTTPAIADIDGDGHDELVLAVSYFYDREYYDDPEHAKDLKGIDIGKYVASGIAVFDLRTRTEKWVQHLDLSTDATTYKAYAYSSPTLVDLDGDGRLEVVVGTSMGFAYVLDCKGNPLPGWPIQMGEIQAQPLVADINNDGELEVFVADMRGNLAAFSPKGEEVWERHVHSAVSQGAVAGDVDGDGQLEVVFGTASGHVYALAGSTGADIPKWPYRARGRVQAPVTLSHLMEGSGLQVLVPAFDGFLYVIDGLQGCADVADLGETSYAAVLVDDLDGDGLLELLATTMNGNVYAFETGAPYHPLKTWTSQVLGPNGQVARYGYVGIAASPATRQARDVAGERLQVAFEVLDKRVAFADNGTLLPGGRGPYNVTVVLKGVGVREMASGDAPVVGVADSFPGPGRYVVDIPCPRSQASAVVRLEMVDSSGLLYSDEFALSFHMHFHRLLKWAVALPLGLMLAVLAAVAGPEVARHTRNAMEPAYVGTYIYMTGLAVLYVVLVCALEFHRTPELVEEKAAAAAAAAADKAAAADAAKAATRLNKAGSALSQSSDSSEASDSDPSGTAAAGRQQRQRQGSPLAVADASGAATPSTEPAEPAAALAVPPQPPPQPQPQHPQHPHPLPPHPSLPPPQPQPPQQQHRPLRALFLTSGYLVPAATAAVAYGGMAGLMTASPLALKDSGVDFGETIQVIQVHILCMFVPSLFTGNVIQLVSARWTMALGALLQLGGNAVFFAGRSLGIYFAGNAVVGLGWNWAYVGASALVAASYQPQEKFLAQGVLDCGVLLATGIAVVLAGVLYAGIGWTSYIGLFMGVNGFMVAMDVWLLLRLELPRVAAAMRRGRE